MPTSIIGSTEARVRVMALVIVVFAAASPSPAADPHTPHPHQGVLPPYEGMPRFDLGEEQLARLARGKIVTLTVADSGGDGRGLAVIDIAAPPAVVWSRIMDVEHYAEWVGPVKEAAVYAHDGHTYRTRTKVSGLLYKYEYFLVNTYDPDRSLMTWTLDYERESDFDDCVGAWLVEAHPEKEGWSRAWFSTDLRLRNPPPAFLMDWIKKKGLKDSTRWVKRESEEVMRTHKEPPAASLQDWE